MNIKLLLGLLLASLIFITCRKESIKSADKRIVSFVFTIANNAGKLTADVKAHVQSDTIMVGFKPATSLVSLVPQIDFKGKSITPANKVPQNFSSPVKYTVTAEDGSTKMYTVIAKNLSSEKEITSFVFKAADNNVLDADLQGIIAGDTISVLVPSDADLTALKPSIVFKGKSISPVPNTAQNFSSPVYYSVVAEDNSARIYTVIAKVNADLFVGSFDSSLYCLDATTGKLKWTYKTGGSILSSPTVSEGKVYFGSYDGYVYALNAHIGSLYWKKYLGDRIGSCPTVRDNVVYVTRDRSGYPKLFALDALTGNEIWQANSYIPYSSPTIFNNTIYACSAEFRLIAFNLATGELLWAQADGSGSANPLVYNGKIYTAGESFKMNCIDGGTGSMIWSYLDASRFGGNASATAKNGVVYAGGLDKKMYAYDAETGAIKWTYESTGSKLLGYDYGYFSAPVTYKDVIICGNNDGHVYGINSDGTKRWEIPFDAIETRFDYANATVANDLAYIGSANGKVYCFNPLTGSIKWSYQTGRSVLSGPCIVDSKGIVFHPGISGDQN